MKRIIIYTTISLAAAAMSAETLTPAQALARVQNSTVRKIANRAAAEASSARVIALENEPQMYLFTPADGGLLLLSAESETPALIGYAENYIAGDELPPAMEGMMRCWAAEIQAQRDGAVIYGSRAETADFAPINPICQTRWDQGSPYNAKCPVLNGSRTYTGCVATAMAQIMNIYKYPEKCSGGTYSYTWQSGAKTLSLNFNDVELDWDNMANTYSSSSTQAQKDAVATLMQAIGYSSKMEYTTYGSGTTGIYLFQGLLRNFDYDAATLEYANRAWFTLSDWQKKVYDTLAEGFPVYYDGVTNDAEPLGHAFVVDGYRGDGYFHLNWGWSGMSDGYFLLTALDPDAQGIGGAYASAGYDAQQGAIFGMKKGNTVALSAAPAHVFINGDFYTPAKSATLGASTTFGWNGNLTNYSAATINIIPAIKITAENGTVYNVNYGYSIATLNVAYTISSYQYDIRIPSDLPDGKYTITPAIYRSTDKQYYDVYCNIGYGTGIKATVNGSTITYESKDTPQLKARDVVIPETIYVNKAFNISGTIESIGGESYYDPIKLRIYRNGSTTASGSIGSFMLSVDSGTSTDFSANITTTASSLKTGTYQVALADAFGNIISDKYDVELISPDDLGALKASNLECVSANKNDLKFKVTLAASEGNYKGTVYIELHLKGDYNNYQVRIPSEVVEINNGSSKTITISGAFPEGVVGQDYTAYVYYTRMGEWTEASGRQRKNFTLAEEASIDEIAANVAADAEYYDLSGRRIATPHRSGIYIRRIGSTTTKIQL